MPMTESVRRVTTDAEYDDALAVRKRVFVEEQGVPEPMEVDEHEDAATHFVAYDDGRAVGAARLRSVGEATGKVERVAVLASLRGEGWGRRLMAVVEETARETGLDHLKLHSQTSAAGFYDRLGYERVGDEFEEAGIPHVEMRKSLGDG